VAGSICRFARDPAIFAALTDGQNYGLCPDSAVRRVFTACHAQDCRSINQLIADFCRVCGLRLDICGDGQPGPQLFWSVPAYPPIGTGYLVTPQMLVRGDVLVTPQNLNLVLTTISNGNSVGSIANPGAGSFSSSPLGIRERIYSCSPGRLLEYSLVTREMQSHDLGGFQPSESTIPVHVSGQGTDYIVVPGKTKPKGKVELLIYDIKSRDSLVFQLTLSPEDSFFTPVSLPRAGVFLTTRRGAAFIASNKGAALSDWKVGRVPVRVELPRQKYFSAPARCPTTGMLFVQSVDAASLDRGMWVVTTRGQKHFRLGTPPEKYDSDSLDLLIFPPLVYEGQAVVRSMSPGTCHFVSAAQAQTISIGGLSLDPIATTAGNGKILTVSDGTVQVFKFLPGHQPADSIGIGALAFGPAVNKPVYFLGKIFIQTPTRLIGWEV